MTGAALAPPRIESEDDTFTTPQPAGDNGPLRVESPMVGVFYRAPNPSAAFVDVGDPLSRVRRSACSRR